MLLDYFISVGALFNDAKIARRHTIPGIEPKALDTQVKCSTTSITSEQIFKKCKMLFLES